MQFYGQAFGSRLTVQLKETSEYRVSVVDDKKRKWEMRSFGAITQSERDRVVFIGVRGNTGFGGVSVDSITIQEASCPQPTIPPSRTNKPKKMEGSYRKFPSIFFNMIYCSNGSSYIC